MLAYKNLKSSCARQRNQRERWHGETVFRLRACSNRMLQNLVSEFSPPSSAVISFWSLQRSGSWQNDIVEGCFEEDDWISNILQYLRRKAILWYKNLAVAGYLRSPIFLSMSWLDPSLRLDCISKIVIKVDQGWLNPRQLRFTTKL